MHAIYTTLKTRIAILGVCIAVLGFGADSVWAQSDGGGYDRLAEVKATTSTETGKGGYDRVATVGPAAFSTYPNPFNPEATIRFDVSKSQHVRVSVFNELGQQVLVLVNGQVEAGQHEARLVAYGLPSGTYFVRLETDTGVTTRSVVLMK